MFHLSPAERRGAGITHVALPAAVLEDIDAEDPARREYVDIQLDGLELSSILLAGDDVTAITLRTITIDGEFVVS